MADDRKVPRKNDEEKQNENDFYFALGLEIAAERIRRKMTQQELADILHISTNTLSLYERGVSKIRAYEIKTLCRI